MTINIKSTPHPTGDVGRPLCHTVDEIGDGRTDVSLGIGILFVIVCVIAIIGWLALLSDRPEMPFVVICFSIFGGLVFIGCVVEGWKRQRARQARRIRTTRQCDNHE